jgi:hypothetical protein
LGPAADGDGESEGAGTRLAAQGDVDPPPASALWELERQGGARSADAVGALAAGDTVRLKHVASRQYLAGTSGACTLTTTRSDDTTLFRLVAVRHALWVWGRSVGGEAWACV